MDILVNDLAIHRQFDSIPSFHEAFERLMAMRGAARRLGYDILCQRDLLTKAPVEDMTMQQAIAGLHETKRRPAMTWLANADSFWDHLRQHSSDDYLESDGELVTDSAVGEAAFRMLHGSSCGLVSIIPSHWNYSPVDVTWRLQDEGLQDKAVSLKNWRTKETLAESLRGAEKPIASWDGMQEVAIRRFSNLTFIEGCFEPLRRMPFAKGSANRLFVLFDALDQLVCAFDENGVRTPDGHRIIEKCFTGDRAWFSDSSESEKRDFRHELTFPHPTDPAQALFCPWHGKVSSQTIRFHFSWPVRYGMPTYITYVGLKKTKR